jgi:hypothetical protein
MSPAVTRPVPLFDTFRAGGRARGRLRVLAPEGGRDSDAELALGPRAARGRGNAALRAARQLGHAPRGLAALNRREARSARGIKSEGVGDRNPTTS